MEEAEREGEDKERRTKTNASSNPRSMNAGLVEGRMKTNASRNQRSWNELFHHENPHSMIAGVVEARPKTNESANPRSLNELIHYELTKVEPMEQKSSFAPTTKFQPKLQRWKRRLKMVASMHLIPKPPPELGQRSEIAKMRRENPSRLTEQLALTKSIARSMRRKRIKKSG